MATKYDKMSMTELKKIAKSIGYKPVYSDGTPLDKDTLADAIHQFSTEGMVKKKAGMTVGRANYPDKKKPQEGPMYDPRKTKPKKKTTKKKGGGKIGCSHNRLY